MTIRDSRREDFASIVRLMRFTSSIPVTEEWLVEAQTRMKSDIPFLRLVAEIDGEVVAYSKSQRREIPSPIRYVLTVGVLPEHREQGLGKKLYDLAEAHALQSGAQSLWVQTVEDDVVGEGFAQRRGFEKYFFVQDLSLDLRTFDATKFRGVVKEVEAAGIRFTNLPEVGDTLTNRRLLYELNEAVEKDVPVVGEDGFMTYEDWERRVMAAPWFDPAGQIIALDGEKWIGIGAIGRMDESMYLNSITGVLREYRGRKIALALKLRGIEYAQAMGAISLRTQNHGTNEPIRAINSKLGYAGLPGWNTWEKAVMGNVSL